MKFKCILVFFALTLSNFLFSISADKISISATVIHSKGKSITCRVKTSVKNGWEISDIPSFSIISGVDSIDKVNNVKIDDSTYESELKITKLGEGDITLEVGFPACNDICAFASKEFTINEDGTETTWSKYLYMFIFAFIGGLILNFMPCVLPVLTIKIRSFIGASGKDKKHLLYTWIGIIFSFMVFAISMIILKRIGETVGLGMHFQNLYFLNISTLFVFFFVLYTYERINVFISPNIELEKKGAFLKNFLSGVLGTILSIPCTAPFLGTAATFALSGSDVELATVFMLIGLGFGFPYILFYFLNIPISIKPGKWTNVLKHILNIGIVFTFIWLAWLLSNHMNTYYIMIMSMLYIFLFFAVSKFRVLSIIIAICICAMPYIIKREEPYQLKREQSMWIPFDAIEIQNSIKRNRVVFVNITADWCMTCKYNEKILLDTQEFKDVVDTHKIICMKGDLTHKNESVSIFLKIHKQSGIPFNLIFGPKAPSGIYLPVVPSIGDVEKAIKEAR